MAHLSPRPGETHGKWLRAHGAAEPTPVELFFDLVYALAVTQLTHYLLDHLTLRGVGETFLLLLAVWLGWIHVVWTTNYFDLGKMPVRIMLLVLMLAGLVLSASLPEAFNSRGMLFAVSFLVVMVGGTAFLLTAVGRNQHLSHVLERVLICWSTISALWLIGGLVDGNLRVAIWVLAVILAYVAMWLGFPVPWLGRSHTTDYTITGEHLALRCQLFIILALGESILVTGANFGAVPITFETTVAFVVAFIASVTLWWIYFDRGAEASVRIMASATDPGRLGISAFTYYHIPMVAGIILFAAADELTLAHPHEPVELATAAVIIGGPMLYLIGNSLYKRTLWHHVPRSRYIGLIALAILALFSYQTTALILLTAVTVVVLFVALWDFRTLRQRDIG